MSRSEKPNLIERMENLICALDSAQEWNAEPGDHHDKVMGNIDDAAGIAGEILTMIDGR